MNERGNCKTIVFWLLRGKNNKGSSNREAKQY